LPEVDLVALCNDDSASGELMQTTVPLEQTVTPTARVGVIAGFG
jgi:hypothetical protein